MNVFNQKLDVHAPITQIKHSTQQPKRNVKPWITPEILKMIKLKDKTYQKLVKQKNPTTRILLKNTYKEQNNQND